MPAATASRQSSGVILPPAAGYDDMESTASDDCSCDDCVECGGVWDEADDMYEFTCGHVVHKRCWEVREGCKICTETDSQFDARMDQYEQLIEIAKESAKGRSDTASSPQASSRMSPKGAPTSPRMSQQRSAPAQREWSPAAAPQAPPSLPEPVYWDNARAARHHGVPRIASVSRSSELAVTSRESAAPTPPSRVRAPKPVPPRPAGAAVRHWHQPYSTTSRLTVAQTGSPVVTAADLALHATPRSPRRQQGAGVSEWSRPSSASGFSESSSVSPPMAPSRRGGRGLPSRAAEDTRRDPTLGFDSYRKLKESRVRALML